jgi:hypothetical protein
MRILKRAIERRRSTRRRADERRGGRRRADGRRSSTLAALMTGALALPGMLEPAAADTPESWIPAEYRFSLYLEHDLPKSQVAPGSETERMEVQAHQFSASMPLLDRFEIGLDVAYETMSGASPWYVIPGADGDDPVQVMTGATIEDTRTDVLAKTSYYLDSGRAALSGGVSIENDYLAFNAGIDGETHFNDGNTSLLLGGGVSIDTLEPTDAEDYEFRPEKESKQSYSLSGGVAQILSRNIAVQSSVNYQHSRGFLSDPYKRVVVAGAPIGDSRPDSRNQLSWLTRYRQHVDEIDATLHLDYRFFIDDWQITSHTVELAWYQTIWKTLRVIPSFRYYSQSQADFYAPYFFSEPKDGYASSDYRLSPFGALAFRIRAEAGFDTWNIQWRTALTWERYLSSGDYALGKVAVANPGLVNFDLFTVALRAKF